MFMCVTLSNNILDCYPFINQSPNDHYFLTQLYLAISLIEIHITIGILTLIYNMKPELT